MQQVCDPCDAGSMEKVCARLCGAMGGWRDEGERRGEDTIRAGMVERRRLRGRYERTRRGEENRREENTEKSEKRRLRGREDMRREETRREEKVRREEK